jgi:hypothetical protein
MGIVTRLSGTVVCTVGVVCTAVGVVCTAVGVVCTAVGVVCTAVGLVCTAVGLVCTAVGLVCGELAVDEATAEWPPPAVGPVPHAAMHTVSAIARRAIPVKWNFCLIIVYSLAEGEGRCGESEPECDGAGS